MTQQLIKREINPEEQVTELDISHLVIEDDTLWITFNPKSSNGC